MEHPRPRGVQTYRARNAIIGYLQLVAFGPAVRDPWCDVEGREHGFWWSL